MKVGIAGSGRVGTALALALARHSRGPARRSRGPWLAGVYARRSRDSRSLARRCGTGEAFASVEDLIDGSDVVVICVADSALEAFTGALAGVPRASRRIFLHTSGSRGAGALSALAAAGASTGAMHPLASFPPSDERPYDASFLHEIFFAVSGSGRAERAALAIARSLGSRVVKVPDRARPAWHLAASIVSNHTAVLAGLALDLLAREGRLGGRPVREAFAALLRTTADRIERDGPARGLTGPASRGDAGTLRRHLALLTRRRDLRRLYALLSVEAVRIAIARGDLPRSKAAAALRVLGASRR